MEVSLLHAEGLPEGCLLSVRSGTTRRQQPAKPEKVKLRFSQWPKACSEPLRVDLLAPVGGASVKVQPGIERYEVAVPSASGNGENRRVMLQVRQTSSPEGELHNLMPVPEDQGSSVAAAPASPNVRHRQTVLARTYLDKHSVLTWVQDMLQELIAKQPSDPWGFIENFLSLHGQCHKATNTPAEQHPTTRQVAPAGPSPEDEAELDVETLCKQARDVLMDKAEDPSDEHDTESLCRQARAVLEGGAEMEPPGMVSEAGRQLDMSAVAHKEEAGTGLAPIRALARGILTEGSLDGRLTAALTSVCPEAALQACELDVEASEVECEGGRPQVLSGECPSNSQTERGTDCTSREPEAEQSVVQEADTAQTSLPEPEEEQDLCDGFSQHDQTPAAAEAFDIPALRQEACALLGRAAQDGALQAALEVSSEDSSKAALRRRAGATLLRATTSGALAEQLRRRREQPCTSAVAKTVEADAELRRRAGATLLRASKSGALGEELRRRRDPGQEVQATQTFDGDAELRRRAGATLMRAGKSGALVEELRKRRSQELQESCESRESGLRNRAGATLLRASKSGALAEELKKRRGRTQANDDLLTLRERLRAELSEGFKSGRLAKAFHSLDSTEAFRQRACSGFCLGWQSGKLDEALEGLNRHKEEELRQTVHAELSAALRSGKLQSALRELSRHRQEASDLEDLRIRARGELLGAADSGRLVDVIAGLRGEAADIDDLRERATQVFARGAKSGELQSALDGLLAEKAGVEQLRGLAGPVLLQAAESGQLARLLAGGQTDKEDTASKGTSHALEGNVRDEGFVALRKRACSFLNDAVATGQLEELLASCRAEASSSPAALRRRALAALQRGADSGAIAGALGSRPCPSTSTTGQAPAHEKAAPSAPLPPPEAPKPTAGQCDGETQPQKLAAPAAKPQASRGPVVNRAATLKKGGLLLRRALRSGEAAELIDKAEAAEQPGGQAAAPQVVQAIPDSAASPATEGQSDSAVAKARLFQDAFRSLSHAAQSGSLHKDLQLLHSSRRTLVEAGQDGRLLEALKQLAADRSPAPGSSAHEREQEEVTPPLTASEAPAEGPRLDDCFRSSRSAGECRYQLSMTQRVPQKSFGAGVTPANDEGSALQQGHPENFLGVQRAVPRPVSRQGRRKSDSEVEVRGLMRRTLSRASLDGSLARELSLLDCAKDDRLRGCTKEDEDSLLKLLPLNKGGLHGHGAGVTKAKAPAEAEPEEGTEATEHSLSGSTFSFEATTRPVRAAASSAMGDAVSLQDERQSPQEQKQRQEQQQDQQRQALMRELLDETRQGRRDMLEFKGEVTGHILEFQGETLELQRDMLSVCQQMKAAREEILELRTRLEASETERASRLSPQPQGDQPQPPPVAAAEVLPGTTGRPSHGAVRREASAPPSSKPSTPEQTSLQKPNQAERTMDAQQAAFISDDLPLNGVPRGRLRPGEAGTVRSVSQCVSITDLEERVRARNDRVRNENQALREGNARLRHLHEMSRGHKLSPDEFHAARDALRRDLQRLAQHEV